MAVRVESDAVKTPGIFGAALDERDPPRRLTGGGTFFAGDAGSGIWVGTFANRAASDPSTSLMSCVQSILPVEMTSCLR